MIFLICFDGLFQLRRAKNFNGAKWFPDVGSFSKAQGNVGSLLIWHEAKNGWNGACLSTGHQKVPCGGGICYLTSSVGVCHVSS